MANNIGKIPIDYSSEVGTWRLLTGDTSYTATSDPTEGEFEYWGDAEIQGYIDSFGMDSIERAIGMAYLALAGKLAVEAENIRTHDLQVDTRSKAEALLKIANRWLLRADEKDSGGGLDEAFLVSPVGRSGCNCEPELSPRLRLRCGQC